MQHSPVCRFHVSGLTDEQGEKARQAAYDAGAWDVERLSDGSFVYEAGRSLQAEIESALASKPGDRVA